MTEAMLIIVRETTFRNMVKMTANSDLVLPRSDSHHLNPVHMSYSLDWTQISRRLMSVDSHVLALLA